MNDDFYEDDIYYDNEINICDPTDCYFSNNFDVYNEDYERYNIDYDIKECPFCSYNYENLANMKNKINYEFRLNEESIRNKIREKFTEAILTTVLGVLFFVTIVYFLIKVYLFSE